MSLFFTATPIKSRANLSSFSFNLSFLLVSPKNLAIFKLGNRAMVAADSKRASFSLPCSLSVRFCILLPKSPDNIYFSFSVPNIFAIGDVIDGSMLAHRASHEGIAVAEMIAGGHPHVNYMAIPNVIYTHPEVAAVGLTEGEARSSGINPKVGTSYFRGNPRARCSGDMDGLVKIIGDSNSGRLIGLHIIGPNASEMIGEGVIAIEKKATLADIASAPHAHPTLSEAIMEAAQNALGYAIHG